MLTLYGIVLCSRQGGSLVCPWSGTCSGWQYFYCTIGISLPRVTPIADPIATIALHQAHLLCELAGRSDELPLDALEW